MRRLFFSTKTYDYSSKAEAERHIKEMESKKWRAQRQDDGNFIFANSQDTYPYSVVYFKEA